MELTITGLEQVQRRLAAAPRLVVAKAFLKALDRAAGIIAAEVEARTPEGELGLLRESVITSVEIDSDGRGGTAHVGFSGATSERTGKPQDLIALWVEFGHVMKSHRKKTIGHVPPHPFMRPAADATADRAIDVFAASIEESLPEVIES